MYYSSVNNDKYVVVAYGLVDDDYHHIRVMDFDGNLVNEIKFKKDDDEFHNINLWATEKYIYYNFEDEKEIYRVKYLGSSIETVVSDK